LVPQIKTPTQGNQFPGGQHAGDFHAGISVGCQCVLELPVGDQDGQGVEVEGMLYWHRKVLLNDTCMAVKLFSWTGGSDPKAASPQKWDGYGEPSLPWDFRGALPRRVVREHLS
jgi:hypothetical protein